MTKEKYLGCIYGLAIGDALGFPNEFHNRKTNLSLRGKELTDFEPVIYNLSRGKTEIHNRKKKFKPYEDFPLGTYTDDTQMSLAIARALIKSGIQKYDINKIMHNVQEEFINWLNNEQNNRAPGKACLAGCQKLAEGISWKESGDYTAKGCGAAMRSAPIGLIFFNDLEKLVETAEETSRCTHAHPTAISAGIATAYLTALALKKENHVQWIDNMLQKEFFNDEFKNRIAKIKKVLPYTNPFKALEQIGCGWKGDEAVAMALYCILKNPHDYSKAVLTAANIDGDTDSVACITGAISGAYNGIENIPRKWIEKVENSALLREMALRIYNKEK